MQRSDVLQLIHPHQGAPSRQSSDSSSVCSRLPPLRRALNFPGLPDSCVFPRARTCQHVDTHTLPALLNEDCCRRVFFFGGGSGRFAVSLPTSTHCRVFRLSRSTWCRWGVGNLLMMDVVKMPSTIQAQVLNSRIYHCTGVFNH